MRTITGKDNQYLKLARSLASKKARRERGCFLVEGLRLSEELLASSFAVRYGLCSERISGDGRGQALLTLAAARGIELYMVEQRLLDGVSAAEHTQGILFVVELPMAAPLPVLRKQALLGDRIADPGNLGAMLRTAQAAGAAAFITNAGCADLFAPKTVRASMGALFKLPLWAEAADEDVYAACRVQGLEICVAAACGENVFAAPPLWVLGAEAVGVSEFWLSRADRRISLPMAANAESLNVAAAAAVLLYQGAYGGFAPPAAEKI
ncbi:MAG: RNA methyltransferase [Bacillota bacterium]|nr:RNA methyltransferase [Bacillota bacterium]